VATRAGVKRLFLCHFSADLHDRVNELRREVVQSYQGPFEIPEEVREYRV
jgi:ribonuclease BN (tRNA processing enzyme)